MMDTYEKRIERQEAAIKNPIVFLETCDWCTEFCKSTKEINNESNFSKDRVCDICLEEEENQDWPFNY